MSYIDFCDTEAKNEAFDLLRDSNAFVETEDGEWCLEEDAILINSEWYYGPSTDHIICESCNDAQHSEDCIVTDDNQCYCSDGCAEDEGYHRNCNGEWTQEPEVDEHGLASYDSVNNKKDTTSREHPYLIGLEIEKEDDAYILDAAGLAEGVGWIAVSDGSLDDDTGFEIVSPAYNLTDPSSSMLADIEELEDILDADCSIACGGHITVSERGVSGEKLAARLGESISLLFALYPKRLKKRGLVSPTTKKDEKNRAGKYRAVNVMEDRVELRIFARVKSADQLRWRIDLLRLFLDDAQPTIWRALDAPDSPLYKHLRKVYTVGQIDDKRTLFRDFDAWRESEHVSTRIVEYVPGDVTPEGPAQDESLIQEGESLAVSDARAIANATRIIPHRPEGHDTCEEAIAAIAETTFLAQSDSDIASVDDIVSELLQHGEYHAASWLLDRHLVGTLS